jgi:cytochrome d ubiquinol oxidase subunit I
MDVLLLSRIQLGATISFHYLYPPLSIGLGVMLVVMEGVWLKTGNPLYHRMARFWTKVFALTFALGVATGSVMEFEFGTNWAAYSRFVGDVFGSGAGVRLVQFALGRIFTEPPVNYVAASSVVIPER